MQSPHRSQVISLLLLSAMGYIETWRACERMSGVTPRPTDFGGLLWQCCLAVAFGEMLAVGFVAKWLCRQEFFDPEARKVGHEKPPLETRFLRAAELSQGRSQNRARRGAVRDFAAQRCNGAFVLARSIFGFALYPVIPGWRMRIQPHGGRYAC